MSITDVVKKAIIGISAVAALGMSGCDYGKNEEATVECYRNNGKIDTFSVKCEFDSKGRLTKETTYKYGKAKPHMTVTCDNTGNSIVYDSLGDKIREYKFER